MMVNRFNLFLLLLIYSVGIKAGAANVSGDYHNRFNCLKIAQDGTCSFYQLSQDLLITNINEKKVKVFIETKLFIKNPEWEPYYCSLEGYATYKDGYLVLYQDINGHSIDNIKIIIKSDFLIIEAAESKLLKYYCGEHISINNNRFSRLKKTVIKRNKNLEGVY